MKRRPYSSPKEQEAKPIGVPEVSPEFFPKKWPRWLTTVQSAIYLGKFRKVDGEPSEGAIRNLIYRKKIVAQKYLGRILIDRLELDRLIGLSPHPGGGL